MRRTPLLAGILAIFILTLAVHADPLDDQLAAARALLGSGKRQEAAAKFEALKADVKQRLVKTPGDAHLHFLLGSICMDGGDDDEAAVALDKAVELDPKNAQYLSTRALLLEYQEKPAEAIKLLKRAADAAPNDPDAWTHLARAQSAAKQFAEARESINKAIALNPKDAHYIGMLGETYATEGKNDEALKLYTQAVTLDPTYTLAFMNIGQLHQSAGRLAESLAAYEKGLKLAPDDWRAWAKEVQLYEAMKEPKERDAAREKILALWKAGKVDQPLYCREQFAQGKNNVMVFEYFELKGERAVRYSFNIVGPDGKIIKKISLGSYETTTQIAREMGDIKPDERMYHLDEYSPNRHATLGMFKKEPTWEETRKMVADHFDGKLNAMSSTTYPPAEEKKK